eukprot:845004_1
MSKTRFYITICILLNFISNTMGGPLPVGGLCSSGHPPAADGFCNDPCTQLSNFSIDGDWWATSETEVDWSTVLDGTRTTNGNTGLEWATKQNQCAKSTARRSGWYYQSGVFCDTFDNNEQSLLQNGPPGTLDLNPNSWVPLLDSPMNDKGDLINAYYVVDKLNMIMCTAMDRIDVNGASYMDMEFSQQYYDDYTVVDPAGTTCTKDINDPADIGTTWKCRYPIRTDGDIQISFDIANDIRSNVIIIYQWDSTASRKGAGTGNWVPIRTEEMANAAPPYNYYMSPDGAFEAAVNKKYFNASVFRFICDEKAYNDDIDNGGDGSCCTCEGTDNEGTFFEACIDWAQLGIHSISFTGLTIKARSSATGAYKDTSGVLENSVVAPQNYDIMESNPWCRSCDGTYENSPNAKCNITQTPFPTRNPTLTTDNPTTAQPTSQTTPPTAQPTNSTNNPTTSSPTTLQPTDQTFAPTGITFAPTGITPGPTHPSNAPTSYTPGPSPGPTVTKGTPSRAPTFRPTGGPSPGPTVPEGSPSRSPTLRPSIHPTKYPTLIPSLNPTINTGCDGDDSFDREDCPEDPLPGCFLQFNITFNVCILNKKFTRNDIYKDFKDAVIYQIEGLGTRFEQKCTESNVRAEYYNIIYADQTANTAGQLLPMNSNECTECTIADAEFKYSITTHISFYCGQCDLLKAMLTDFGTYVDSWRKGVNTQFLAHSKGEDNVCGNGFGKTTLIYLSGVFKNDQGIAEGDCIGDCNVITDGQDDGGDDGG